VPDDFPGVFSGIGEFSIHKEFADAASGSPDARTPFARPEYHLSEEEEGAKAYEAQAAALVDEASQAIATLGPGPPPHRRLRLTLDEALSVP
jgi:hypothetical protein